MSDHSVPEPSRQPSPPWTERLDRLRSTVATLPRAAVVGGVATVVVVVVLAVVLLRPSGAPRPLVLPRADAAGPSASPASNSPPTSGGDEGAPAETVTVHAAGAVAKPGVYVVPGRARVADVLAAAGGALPDADVDQLNLAAKVADAQRIYVPRRGEATPAAGAGDAPGATPPGGGEPSAPGAPIDLNAATATQLDALPGVGPATAKAIVDYRSAHGRFHSVTDLLGVRGIGPAKLDAIRPLVTVSAG